MTDVMTKTEFSTEEALAAAKKVAAAFTKTAETPTHLRAKALAHVSRELRARKEEFARTISEEVTKPLKEARREVDRAALVFEFASEETKRFGGEWLPIDFEPATEGRSIITRRVPRGPALFIAPFNFPLNLVAHKVAPAVATGTAFILKPPPQAPRVSQLLAQLLLDGGWPQDAFAVVPCSNLTAEALVTLEDFRTISFTGSAAVGWRIKALSGKKHTVLELGGNAAVAIAPDADLPWAAARCAWGGFYYSGQVCISVQRIFTHKTVAEDFKAYFLANVKELKIGEVSDEKTDIGPLINDAAAERVQAWIDEAKKMGAKVLLGGERKGRFIPPTVLERVPASCKVSCEEVFGPVVVLDTYENWNEVIERINAGPYGLQAGIFTRDLERIMDAWQKIRVGGLIVNDIPAFRSDAMPYGGSKDSGMGREGVRYAMEEYTEPRVLVLKP